MTTTTISTAIPGLTLELDPASPRGGGGPVLSIRYHGEEIGHAWIDDDSAAWLAADIECGMIEPDMVAAGRADGVA